MFNYEGLSWLEKKIINLIGDDMSTRPLETYTNTKNRRVLYEKYLQDHISEEQYESILTDLYYKGIISFISSEAKILDNLSSYAEQEFKKNYEEYEKPYRERDSFVRLTVQGERKISGITVYQRIVQDELSLKYSDLKQLVENLEQNVSNINNKYIELMAVFIAIFTIIIGNIGLYTSLENIELLEIVFLIFLTNGTILLGIMFLLLAIRTLVFNQTLKLNQIGLLLMPLLLILMAIFILMATKLPILLNLLQNNN